MMIELAPSVMCADLLNVGANLRTLEHAGIRWLHVDIMDGTFAPSFTFGRDFVLQLRSAWPYCIDLHLMSDRPLVHLQHFLGTSVDLISVHVERAEETRTCLGEIMAAGIKPGLAVSPGSDLSGWGDIIGDLGAVLLMGVPPGSVGHPMDPDSPRRIGKARRWLNAEGCEHVPIIFDGGVSTQTIGELARAGAERFVSGSALFHGPDLNLAVKKLRLAGLSI